MLFNQEELGIVFTYEYYPPSSLLYKCINYFSKDQVFP